MKQFTAPSADRIVLPYVLEAQAAGRPGGTCVRFDDGSLWTWDDAAAVGRRSAANLRQRGIDAADRVLIFLPNGRDWLVAWLGVAYLRAVVVPVHLSHRASMLAHVCNDSGATAIITTAELAERLDDELRARLQIVEPDALTSPAGDEVGPPPLHPSDVHFVNYTSGTTGRAKGVLTTHLQSYYSSLGGYGLLGGLTASDRWLLTVPLYHVAGQQICLASWSVGASVALETQFQARTFWETAARTGSTCGLLVGAMGAILAERPPTPADRAHGLRYLLCAPMPPDVAGFRDRFGVEALVSGLGSTEMGGPLLTRIDEPYVAGSCGKVRDEYETRLVDEHDFEVPVGAVGELVVRPRIAWIVTPGYVGRPAETAEAWRNGWFHTGDLFRVDGDGNHFFIDRRRDSFRRKGENISSFEVESELIAFAGIVQAACVATRDEVGEDEVKAFVVLAEGATLDHRELISFLAARLPHFAVPRYIEIAESLPTTHTGRVQKFELRGLANGPRTWDRLAAGIDVNRDGHVVERP